jgi:hypothetical protein
MRRSQINPVPRSNIFRFENVWLHNNSFLPSILPAWNQGLLGVDAAGQLTACLKATRTAAKVWIRRTRAPPFLKQNCNFLIQLFDLFEETRPLSIYELQVRKDCQACLAHTLKERASYWKQRSKHRAIRVLMQK